jgi:hypothetical protein
VINLTTKLVHVLDFKVKKIKANTPDYFPSFNAYSSKKKVSSKGEKAFTWNKSKTLNEGDFSKVKPSTRFKSKMDVHSSLLTPDLQNGQAKSSKRVKYDELKQQIDKVCDELVADFQNGRDTIRSKLSKTGDLHQNVMGDTAPYANDFQASSRV